MNTELMTGACPSLQYYGIGGHVHMTSTRRVKGVGELLNFADEQY